MSLGSNGVDRVLLLRNVRAMKLHQNCSQRTHPIHPHCTLNSCFGAFCTIWVHLGLLSCLTKLGAKRSELVQKFVPRSCIESFYNERTRSTPLDPKLMFWCIWNHLVALQNSVQNGPNKGKSLCHEVASEFFATNAPDPPRWTLNSCFVVFRTV